VIHRNFTSLDEILSHQAGYPDPLFKMERNPSSQTARTGNDSDLEKASVSERGKAPSYQSRYSDAGQPIWEEETEVITQGYGRRIYNSFKRDPNLFVTPTGSVGADGQVFNPGTAAQATANSPLARKLKGRHLQMIAIGGSIGRFL